MIYRSVEEVVNANRFSLGFDYAERIGDHPLVEGDYYYNSYWGKFYKLISIVSKGNYNKYTVQWEDGEVVTHATPISESDYHIVLAKRWQI